MRHRIIPACAGSTPTRGRTSTRPKDHPRLRGEQVIPCRIIPACAGSTVAGFAAKAAMEDHPRLRGEHDVGAPHRRARVGSSPPARGAHRRGRDDIRAVRIIPACAGSTGLSHGFCLRSQDHPRLRGEHFLALTASPSADGSSPPARGARGEAGPGACRPRIIPACAGSTSLRMYDRTSTSDHPRLRGEHQKKSGSHVGSQGSSPPARGARQRRPLRRLVEGSSPPARGALSNLALATMWLRIIPACAGSTYGTVSNKVRNVSNKVRNVDHPRLRGEHRSSSTTARTARGSSPPARGAHPASTQAHPQRRIIPACAGSTFSRAAGLGQPKDHPRLRGEHDDWSTMSSWAAGSSPPARGARDHEFASCGHERIIPACAGSTR